ncbi:MAG: CPBP family intramembrane glutamic endopeptidase [Phycisphaerales bacterium]
MTHEVAGGRVELAGVPGRRAWPVRWCVWVGRSAVFRVVVGMMALALVAVGVQFAWGLVNAACKGGRAEGVVLVLGGAAVAGCVLGAYLGLVRLVEGAWPAEVRGSAWRWGAEWAGGLVIGGLLVSVAVLVLWVLGVYRVEGVAPRAEWGGIVSAALATNLAAGVVEEVLFRGVLFRLTQQRLGTWWALCVSAVVFGLVHALNPGATLLNGVNLVVQAGVLLGAVYVLTQRLWMAVGVHMAWNILQQCVFGGALSGMEVHAVLHGVLAGPAWLAGGEFGVEGSVVSTVVCLAAGVGALVAARGRFVGRSWPAVH